MSVAARVAIVVMAAAGLARGETTAGGGGEGSGARVVMEGRGVEPETATARARARAGDHMAWWREARFGMFIHWGLYAIPAGEWPGKGSYHAEWIRDSAQIPVGEYEELVSRFDPRAFDADEWVRLARDAGMRYLVITSKHHDGFCLWDSAATEFDVMSTPFKRDVMRELSEACRRTEGEGPGVRFCMYHSIMDWHHPDYLPRRAWEAGVRPAEGADFSRYVVYLKEQLRELCSDRYAPGVLWFDGQWEATWNNEVGGEVEAWVRGLRPGIIINSRVGRGGGAYGLEGRDGGRIGDYSTPEQFIPERDPGVDWETCMTMNDHWGFNAKDENFKSTTDLVRKLCDIASKGGNFLLNVGPTAEGRIPQASVERLREMGSWMREHGGAIYGTGASVLPETPGWGRVTTGVSEAGDGVLWLMVFDWPSDGRVVVPGVLNEVKGASVVTGGSAGASAVAERREADVVVSCMGVTPDAHCTVVRVELVGEPVPATPPVIEAFDRAFVGRAEVTIRCDVEGVEVRYTTDGSVPTAESARVEGPVVVTERTIVSARSFREGRAVSGVVREEFVTAPAKEPVRRGSRDGVERETVGSAQGLRIEYFEGSWDKVPGFDGLKAVHAGLCEGFEAWSGERADGFGYRYRGYVDVPEDGLYKFFVASDDGSRLLIGDEVVVDNDGLHVMEERSGVVGLRKGLHPITVEYFEKTGDRGLRVWWASAKMTRRVLGGESLQIGLRHRE